MITVDASQYMVFAAELDAANARLGSLATAVVTKTAYDVEADTKSTIISMDAVDTGAMLNSVSTDITTGGSSVESETGPTVEYAIYVHDGTSVVAPRPFMQGPFERHSAKLVEAFEQMDGGLL